MGSIVYSPLAQGLLTTRYLNGIPAGSRADRNSFLSKKDITEQLIAKICNLTKIASDRGQTLAQMALAWVLRKGFATSALIGASSVAQLEENLGAVKNIDFTDQELNLIEKVLEK